VTAPPSGEVEVAAGVTSPADFFAEPNVGAIFARAAAHGLKTG
jgi:hypothetical protein